MRLDLVISFFSAYGVDPVKLLMQFKAGLALKDSTRETNPRSQWPWDYGEIHERTKDSEKSEEERPLSLQKLSTHWIF